MGRVCDRGNGRPEVGGKEKTIQTGKSKVRITENCRCKHEVEEKRMNYEVMEDKESMEFKNQYNTEVQIETSESEGQIQRMA
jgi:hypothetical protein